MVFHFYVENMKEIDTDTQDTWNAIADSIYIGVPCIIKCISYVVAFLK